ncbi:hypothetical protein ISN44_As05g043360 [Arabidopsis suecica]|jgi:hypothetical protein|uniref:Secreted protein n=2 Tax=Arabidopsis TaxID=3701 RepID=A0A8T2DPC1_ARASU|nr:hypothetical protein ISN44_As05g043360 [Arabidopsis suecica]CAD5334347.1 unnamed protein product [Arabidopsis thaliana]
MEKNNTKAKLLLALLLSGAEGRYAPEEQSEVITNNQQLWGWFPLPHYGWPFHKRRFGYFPPKAGLNKQNPVPGSQTTGDANVAASTKFP